MEQGVLALTWNSYLTLQPKPAISQVRPMPVRCLSHCFPIVFVYSTLPETRMTTMATRFDHGLKMAHRTSVAGPMSASVLHAEHGSGLPQ